MFLEGIGPVTDKSGRTFTFYRCKYDNWFAGKEADAECFLCPEADEGAAEAEGEEGEEGEADDTRRNCGVCGKLTPGFHRICDVDGKAVFEGALCFECANKGWFIDPWTASFACSEAESAPAPKAEGPPASASATEVV